jgi:hypothetical protein
VDLLILILTLLELIGQHINLLDQELFQLVLQMVLEQLNILSSQVAAVVLVEVV